ncbi:uncharacterized protein [Parasteatoda tepidariorum]|uniref:uncharacterized protein isoform X1 n=2 Tax=Parasteatoda tepidariorum TaxID=114398 RepID=UPI0039BC256F
MCYEESNCCSGSYRRSDYFSCRCYNGYNKRETCCGTSGSYSDCSRRCGYGGMKYDEVPPYCKYFDERDYDTIRPAGLQSKDAKSEFANLYGPDSKSSQSSKFSSDFRKYDRKKNGMPISISCYFDVSNQQNVRSKSNRLNCCCNCQGDKIRRENVSCCSSSSRRSSKREKLFQIRIVPVQQERSYRDTKKLCYCSSERRDVGGRKSQSMYRSGGEFCSTDSLQNFLRFICGTK